MNKGWLCGWTTWSPQKETTSFEFAQQYAPTWLIEAVNKVQPGELHERLDTVELDQDAQNFVRTHRGY